MDKKDTMGGRIQSLRRESGLTQSQLADAIGVSMAAVRNYENNLREPNSKAMAALERFFKVSGDYLRGATDQSGRAEPRHTWDDQEIMKIISEGFPYQFENVMQNLAGCSQKEIKFVADILLEIRHITGLGTRSAQIRESSIEVLKNVVCTTTQYLDSCIAAGAQNSANSERLNKQRTSYLYDIQVALEQAEEVIVGYVSN